VLGSSVPSIIYNPDSGTQVATSLNGAYTACVNLPDGSIVAAGNPSVIYDPVGAAIKSTINVPSSISVAVLNDGRLCFGSSPGVNFYLYDMALGSYTTVTPSGIPNSSMNQSLLLKDGRLFVAAIPSFIWNPTNNSAVSITGLNGNAGAFLPDGRILVVGFNSASNIYDPSNGSITAAGFSGPYFGSSAAYDGRVFLCGWYAASQWFSAGALTPIPSINDAYRSACPVL
jgi:hypothetical protein